MSRNLNGGEIFKEKERRGRGRGRKVGQGWARHQILSGGLLPRLKRPRNLVYCSRSSLTRMHFFS